MQITTCTGTFDGENRGKLCDYMYCPDEDVLYCNFCLKDEPKAKPQPKPEIKASKLVHAPPNQSGSVSAGAASA